MRTRSAVLTSPTRRSIPGASWNSCCSFADTSASGIASSAETVATQKRSFPSESHPGCSKMLSGASSSPMMSPSSFTLCVARLE